MDTFTISDVARAAHSTSPTIHTWLREDYPLFAEGDFIDSERKGAAHKLTFGGALRVGLMAKLVYLGQAPRAAADNVRRVFESGDFSVLPTETSTARGPGELYCDGFTLLIGYVGEDHAEVRKVQAESAWLEFIADGKSAAFIINLNALRQEMLTALAKG